MRKLSALAASLCLLAVCASEAPARTLQCSPVVGAFYTSGDWLRLAQTLAANASSCATYDISIPPLAASKTTIRPNAASQIHALGPNFHALAEINYTAWSGWVSSTGSTWYQAGQEARRRMAAAGFDVSSGDTWAVNELSSAVVNGTGQARQNLRQLVAGLHDGDGSVAQAKGIVFAIGTSQSGTNVASLKARLESWLQDSDFWTDMAANVSGFYQESYGDIRSYAVAGVDAPTRAQYLDQYLYSLSSLAAASPPAASAARAFLASAYGPLANSAWAYNSAYGYTNAGSDVMADYVSAQTYAMRLAGSPSFGFAWDASNPNGLAASDFRAQTSGILARMAGSIHETDAGDPTAACVATGCSAAIPGAAPATGWSTFSTWTPTVAAFTSAPQPLTPNAPSGSVTLQLQTGGIATTLPAPTSVTVTSSSRTGTFATDPAGPWAPSLTLTIPAGTNGATFYVQDSANGSPTISATTGGQVTTQVEIVGTGQTAAPPPPPPAQVGRLTLGLEGAHLHLGLQVLDSSGAPLQARVTARIVNGASTFASTSSQTAADGTFGLTAGGTPPAGCYQAQVVSVAATGYAWDGKTPVAIYCVKPKATIVSVSLGPAHDGLLHATTRVAGEGIRPIRARVVVTVLKGATIFASTGGSTTSAGSFGLTTFKVAPAGCYRVQVTSVAATGYAWDGSSPSATYCVPPTAKVVALSLGRRHGRLHLGVRIGAGSGKTVQGRVSVEIRHGATVFASGAGPTDPAGRFGLTAGPRPAKGCYTASVRTVSALGYRWDGKAAAVRLCVR